MEEQTKRAGHVRKRCFTRAAFRVQTIIKRVVCGYARARLRVYKVWSKSSGEFSRKLFIRKDNTIYESNSKQALKIYIFSFDHRWIILFTAIWVVRALFNLHRLAYSHSFAFVIACLWKNILYYIYFWKEEKLRSDGEKVRLKWLIRCSIVVLSLFIRFMINWFFPLLLDFR